MLKKITIIIFVLTLVACTNSKSEVVGDYEQDYAIREIKTNSSLNNGKLYFPYPIEEEHGEIGVPYVIARYNDGKMTYINDDPSNLCNKGNAKECSTFNVGFIESVLVTDNYIYSIEDSESTTTFESYLTIRELDGSNKKEIFKLKTGYLTVPEFEIVTNDSVIQFIFEDSLYEYNIANETVKRILEDYNMVGISNLHLKDDILYFSAQKLEIEGKQYAQSIIRYGEKDFKILVNDVEDSIIKVYSDKYFVKKINSDGEAEIYVNYFDGESIQIEYDDLGYFSVLNVNEWIVTLTIQYDQDNSMNYIIELFEEGDGVLELRDSLELPKSQGIYSLNAMENNTVILAESKNVENFGLYMEPFYLKIKDGRFSKVKKIPY